MGFMEQLKDTLAESKAVTENGALGYASAGKALVDLNFAVASLRSMNEQEITKNFIHAYYEDKKLAVKWLFFLRDIRCGLGERRSFRVIFNYLALDNGPGRDIMERLMQLVPYYGRFDDLLCLLDTPLEKSVMELFKRQLEADMAAMKEHKPVSLIAKWLPSINATSDNTKNTAKKIVSYLGITAREYRRMLAILREYIKVTEVLASSGRWNEIIYESVPSKANIVFRSAFFKHDGERRQKYLESLKRGETKINAGTLMPHDIVASYCNWMQREWSFTLKEEDTALEELWKNLGNTVDGAGNILCVVDGSGSMLQLVGNTSNVAAIHVSNALGIYFAERLSGPYHNKYITFSRRPEYVDLDGCNTLREKLGLSFSHNDYTNTNIQATFNLVLETAVNNHLQQKELPGTILVISDMEFDSAVTCSQEPMETLFETIAGDFKRYGYMLPKLVFWNVNSRTNVVPVKENKYGVVLVSGFSVNVCKMVLNGSLDPYSCLVEQLNSERYARVEEALAAG